MPRNAKSERNLSQIEKCKMSSDTTEMCCDTITCDIKTNILSQVRSLSLFFIFQNKATTSQPWCTTNNPAQPTPPPMKQSSLILPTLIPIIRSIVLSPHSINRYAVTSAAISTKSPYHSIPAFTPFAPSVFVKHSNLNMVV